MGGRLCRLCAGLCANGGSPRIFKSITIQAVGLFEGLVGGESIAQGCKQVGHFLLAVCLYEKVDEAERLTV